MPQSNVKIKHILGILFLCDTKPIILSFSVNWHPIRDEIFNTDKPKNNVRSFAGHTYQFTHTITTSSLFISTLQCVVLVL